MKKRSIIAIVAMACLALLSLSCQKNAAVSAKEKTLKLDAPSGQHIATIGELKQQAAQVVLNKHGKEQSFEITSIDFLPVAKGYAAIISYRLQNGITSNFAVFSGVKFNVASSSITTSAAQEKDGKVTISCKGTCSCTLSATVNADTGVITVNCGCSGCDATMTQS